MANLRRWSSVETRTFAQLFLENPNLLLQVFDDCLLPSVHPPGKANRRNDSGFIARPSLCRPRTTSFDLEARPPGSSQNPDYQLTASLNGVSAGGPSKLEAHLRSNTLCYCKQVGCHKLDRGGGRGAQDQGTIDWLVFEIKMTGYGGQSPDSSGKWKRKCTA